MTHSMKYNTQSCRLVCKKELQPGIYDFTVESREFASKRSRGSLPSFGAGEDSPAADFYL